MIDSIEELSRKGSAVRRWLDETVSHQRQNATPSEFFERVAYEYTLKWLDKMPKRLYAYCLWRYVRMYGRVTPVFRDVQRDSGNRLPLFLVQAMLDHEADVPWNRGNDFSFLLSIPEE